VASPISGLGNLSDAANRVFATYARLKARGLRAVRIPSCGASETPPLGVVSGNRERN